MKRNADQHGLEDDSTKKVRTELPPGSVEFRFVIPKGFQGLLIGKGGSKINLVRQESGVIASILKVDNQAAPERVLVIRGTVEQTAVAWRLFAQTIADFQAEERKGEASSPDTVTVKVLCDQTLVGAVIGKGGATIRETMATTGAKIQCSNEPLARSTEKTVNITATADVLESTLLIVLAQLRDFPIRPGQVTNVFVPGMAAPAPVNPYGAPFNPYASAHQQDPYASYGSYPPTYQQQAPAVSHGYTGEKHTQKIVIPTQCAGGVIGKGGSRIREIQAQSGCTVRIADPSADVPNERIVTLEGSNDGIQICISLIRQAVEAATAIASAATGY